MLAFYNLPPTNSGKKGECADKRVGVNKYYDLNRVEVRPFDMSDTGSISPWEFYAQTYDATVSDWEGEIDFYQSYVDAAAAKGNSILEIACGTGRVAIRLAKGGANVVGLDFSQPMLDIAREKSQGMANIKWVEQDMRTFDLDESFGLTIIPGHAFQNLVLAEEQVSCLKTIARHLNPGGKLIVHLDHQNVEWLGDLARQKDPEFEEGEKFLHPQTGRPIQTSYAWSYEPSTQTAILQTVWKELDGDGNVTDRWETGPIRLHCLFRFEMEHLLALTGYEVEALYGNFHREPLDDESGSMIWVAKKSAD